MLKNFDSYLGYACCNGHYFRYDEYARTTMTAMTNYKLNGHSITYVKKKIKPEMKLYFNTTKMTFKKSSKYQLPQNPSYLVFNKNNKIIYIEGNWGEASPTGNVRKIVKTGLKTYEVTYNINLYNSWDKINCGLMGTYKIKLKKANNRNGFIITDMKQTVNNKI